MAHDENVIRDLRQTQYATAHELCKVCGVEIAMSRVGILAHVPGQAAGRKPHYARAGWRSGSKSQGGSPG